MHHRVIRVQAMGLTEVNPERWDHLRFKTPRSRGYGGQVGFCDVTDPKVTPILLLLANRFETDPIVGTVFSMVNQLESSMCN